ncbi:MAG: putative lipoprotein [Rhodoferax sp.]|jgi:predicted lipoprotein
MKINPCLRTAGVTLAVAAYAIGSLWPATAQAQSNWQREAVPFYDTIEFLHGIYTHWALPRSQDFELAAQALAPSIAKLCTAPATDTAVLGQARRAWIEATQTWERLSAVAIGPVIERRSQRAIDFTPTRPALIERAIKAQPQGAKAFELVGTPAKGLPALEWLLWTRPVLPGSPSCHYAQEVAYDVALEALTLQSAYAKAAVMAWGVEDEKARSTQAMSEFINQWVGGLEHLRWAQMEKPLRAAQGTNAPDYPRAASDQSLASWTASWASLRSVTVLPDNTAAPAPGNALVPLETYLRGKGLNPLADKLRQATEKVDVSLAQVQKKGVQGQTWIEQTARDLAQLKFLAETEVAPALQVSIGFSDADGD